MTPRLRSLFHAGRGGRARLAAASGLGVRVTLALIGLVTLPISIGYLGNEGYGLLLTITSTITWLQLSTLGIGAGLQNSLTTATARGAVHEQAALVSTAFASLFAIGAVMAIIGGVLFPLVGWDHVFRPSTARYVRELPATVAVVFSCFCAGVVLSAVPATLAARQQLHVAYAAQLAGGLAALAGLILATHLDWGLPGVAASVVGPNVIVNAFTALYLFSRSETRFLRPAFRKFESKAFNRLARKSFGFLVLTLTTIAFYQTDMFILTHTVGPEEAAPYGVAQRVFAQLGAVFTIVTGSLWVAYGNAKAVGDVKWIRNAYRKSRQLQAVVLMGALVAMTLLGEPLLRWWVGERAAPHQELIAMVGILFVVQQWTATHAMVLNGLDVVRPQIFSLLLTGALVVIFSILGAKAYGALGLAGGAALGYVAVAGWHLPFLVRRTFERLDARHRTAMDPEFSDARG